MNIYKFGTTEQDRKALVGAISTITNQPKKYLGTPSLAYQIGDIIIDKHGADTGELPTDLLEKLAERGFQAEIEAVDDASGPEAENEADTISITLPLDGFTPETIDNLRKMVLAKEMPIKKALGVENLPIRVSENGIEFPWFTAEQ